MRSGYRILVLVLLLGTSWLALVQCGGGGGGGGSSGGGGGTDVIGPSGGTVVAHGGALEGTSVTVPAGALTAPTAITIAAVSDILLASFTPVGPAARFTPSGLTFSASATVRVRFFANLLPPGRTIADVVVLKRNDSTGGVTQIVPTSVSATTGFAIAATTSFSTFQAAAPSLSVPNAPGALRASPTAGGQVNLDWVDNATNETGIKIERRLSAGGAFVVVGTAGSNAVSFQDTAATGLTEATSYDYQVRATNVVGDSSPSNITTTTTPTNPNAPDAPSNLGASGVSKTAVTLAWTDHANNESGFKIFRSLFGAGSFGQIGTVGANVTTFLDSTVSTGEAYDYQVRATNGNGDSLASNTATGGPQYDIVYVRYPRHGDVAVTALPDGENPYQIEPGAALILRHPDGTEEVLVDCRGPNDPPGGQLNSSVQDPVISYDGATVYYSKYISLNPSVGFNRQTAHCFIFKMRLDVPANQRVEVQLTGVTGTSVPASGFATDKLGVNRTGAVTINDFGIRDLGLTPLPGGKLIFTSNREALVPPLQGTVSDLDDISAATCSQLYIMDDHDGTALNRNMHLIGYSQLHTVQHPTLLADGRVLFSNWDDAGVRETYGELTLYTCDQDGSNINQFLEPHNYHKRVDHFVTQLTSGHVVAADYYPFMNLWGFGVIFRYDLAVSPPAFLHGSQESKDDFRFFSRKGLENMVPHTNGEDVHAPNGSGRYSMPSAAPAGGLLVSYSPGPVNRDSPSGGPGFPRLDAGIYFIPTGNSTVITNPNDASKLMLIKNDAAFNEIWPRAVVKYRAIHGIPEPATATAANGLGPAQSTRGPAGTPAAFVGTSSVDNRETAYVNGANTPFSTPQGREQAPPFLVQGTDTGLVSQSDLFGIRVVVVTPDRWHTPYPLTITETGQDTPNHLSLVPDSRVSRSVKGYYSHTDENWKILGEFPVQNGAADTSFLAKVPGNTPFFLQGIDSQGRTLFTEQTWRHITPGKVQADCGGCHAHSITGVPFTGRFADSIGYQPVDLLATSPTVINGVTSNRTQTAAWGVEFRRDILPILVAKCASCHTGMPPMDTGGPPVNSNLSMFDSAPPPAAQISFNASVRTYRALARDGSGVYTSGVSIPLGNPFYAFPQMSRYVRAIQSRQSYLAWKVYGQRLDGRTSATSSDDIDFTQVRCAANSSTTQTEKGLFARWIDLGCPIDFNAATRPVMKYTDDSMVPVLTVQPFLEAGVVKIRVGVADVESGIDLASDQSVTVSVTAPLPVPTTVNLVTSSFSIDPATGIGVATTAITAAQFSPGAPLQIFAAATDQAGNRERQERSVGVIP